MWGIFGDGSFPCEEFLFGDLVGIFLVTLDQIFPMKPSKLKISVSYKSYDEKTAIFLKALELFEYRRGYLYMTANRNFVRFAHS